MPTLSPQAKQLNIVFKDGKDGKPYSTHSFGKEVGVTGMSISRMLRGEQPVSEKVTKAVCTKLGYSPAWFINQEGRKKINGEGKKLVTEIELLRLELDISNQFNLQLQARMKGYEQENENLKNEIKEIKKYLKL